MKWPAAIKMLHQITPDIQDRFRQEANLLMQLDHPNLPEIRDYVEDGGRAYIIMEWIAGRDLTTVTHTRQLPEGQLVEIALQTCAALIFVHSHNVIHRDVKPDNIMTIWQPKLHVYLTDLGVARVTSQQRSKLTVVGTHHYASPQQLRGEDPRPSDDIFGLGASLFEAMGLPGAEWTDKVIPFPFGSDDHRLIAQRIAGYPYSDALKAIVLKALQPATSSRYVQVAQMEAELLKLRGDDDGSPAAGPPDTGDLPPVKPPTGIDPTRVTMTDHGAIGHTTWHPGRTRKKPPSGS
jgi:serine/threonine-protein kinase